MKATPCSLLVFLALASSEGGVSAAPSLELIKKKVTNNSGRSQARRLLNRTGGGKWWEEEGFMANLGQPGAARTTKITAKSLQNKSQKQKQNHVGLGNGMSNAVAAPEPTPMRGLRAARRLIPKEGY